MSGRAVSAPEKNDLIAGWYNQKGPVILAIQRQPGAQRINNRESRIKAMIAGAPASIPPRSRSISSPTAPNHPGFGQRRAVT